MTELHRGSCQCGAVRFEIEGEFERFFLCHCSRCRKGSGSSHGAKLFSSTARLTWLSGEDHLRTYRIPAARHQTTFCTNCGAPVPDLRNDGALLMVPAGCLDTPVDFRPLAHIYIASRANWDDHLEDLPAFDERPA
ncbi:GFA family protein [Pseudoruegeria sp. HB172150]|uniref:GFA family protein n=1 Tax=Pseudoruegeria sp. HB172150 TaxID=2721164 RepID=UPI001556E89F|nr:GFA family protein [Pseudoruegeria sp. HB172150]